MVIGEVFRLQLERLANEANSRHDLAASIVLCSHTSMTAKDRGIIWRRWVNVDCYVVTHKRMIIHLMSDDLSISLLLALLTDYVDSVVHWIKLNP